MLKDFTSSIRPALVLTLLFALLLGVAVGLNFLTRKFLSLTMILGGAFGTFTFMVMLAHLGKSPGAGIIVGLVAALGILAGPVGVPRSDAQAKKAEQKGVVVVEGIWPNCNFETGIGINAVTSADPGWPNGGAVFHDTAVWIRKL